MSDAPAFDPKRVPVRPAATIMLVDDRPDLHVLLLRRRAASEFVGGMMVFPGGAVDKADGSADAPALCLGLDDAGASQRLGIESGGLAYWVAAIRETFEEAGVLLAADAETGRVLEFTDPERRARFEETREDVDRERLGLLDVARDEGLRLRADAIHYVGRWITPLGPPRRYDTRFFVAAIPEGQHALHDDREAVHSEWVRPAEAIRQFREQEISMLPPTLGMLRTLSVFSRVDEVLAHARRLEDGPDQEVRLAGRGQGDWEVLLPGDPDYDAASRLHPMRAWVRLWEAGRGNA